MDEYRRVLAEILEDLESLGSGVDAMLRLSSSEAGLAPDQRVPVELSPLLKTVAAFFEPLAADREIALCHGDFPDVSVLGEPWPFEFEPHK